MKILISVPVTFTALHVFNPAFKKVTFDDRIKVCLI
jgi:hypothetical protein